jgi:hypothetical protein
MKAVLAAVITILVVFSGLRADAQIAELQAATGSSDGQVSSLAANALTTTAGDLLVAAVTWDTSAGSTVSIFDSQGNAWATATTPQVDTRNNQALQILYAPNIAGGLDIVTVVPSPAAAWVRLIVHEVAGAALTAPLDQTAVDNTGSGASISVGPVTTAAAGEYIFTAAMNDGASPSATFSAGSGYTLRAVAASADSELASADQVQSAAGSIFSVWALSGSSDSLAQMATFKAVGAPAPTVPTNLVATAVSSSQINLAWAASTDNVGVTGYTVYRGGVQIGTTTTTSYSDTGLAAFTTYSYTVAAFDAAGNLSAPSASASATTLGTAPGPAYPLKASANGRYLVDQNDSPFLMIGDSPQSLVVNLSTADAATYLNNRATNGFNTLMVDAICTTYTGGRANGSLVDGSTVPFTNTLSGGSYDLTTPNPLYWAQVDLIVIMAATNGIQIMLDPIETGGWLGTALDNGTGNCAQYGQFLGGRYAGFPNLIWLSGNDFQDYATEADDAVIIAVANGIKSKDPSHLQTSELNYLASYSLQDANWASLISLDGAYTYYPTYDECLAAYGAANVPVFLEEANYEYEANPGTDGGSLPVLRRQEYWSLLGGALAGHMYGNHYTWTFDSGWQGYLNSPGMTNLQYFNSFFTNVAWYNLVPDQSHTFVTSGYGTYSSGGYIMDNDYATAAVTADGTLGVCYTPVSQTLTVNMAQFSGPATARWFDPSAGTNFTVSGSPFANTGALNFTPPGNNGAGDTDWVLVLQANQNPTSTNTPPVAGTVTLQRYFGSGVRISITDLLTNDTDADGDPITFVDVSATSANGGSVVTSDGWIFYTPPPGSTNSDSFSYTISDGYFSVTGLVVVTIEADNAPSANLTISVLNDGSYSILGDGIPGRTYHIQFADNVQGANWQPLGTATADSFGIFQFIDSAGSPQRFYRSVYP